jgi:hypothetical protein
MPRYMDWARCANSKPEPDRRPARGAGYGTLSSFGPDCCGASRPRELVIQADPFSLYGLFANR